MVSSRRIPSVAFPLRIPSVVAFLCVVLLALPPARANAQLLGTPDSTKLDAALRVMVQSGGTTASVRVIVTPQPGQLDLVPAVLALLGGVLRLTLNTVGTLVADVPVSNLLSLTGAPSVQYVSLDAPVLQIDGNLIAPSLPPSSTYTLRSGLGLSQTTPSALGVGVAVIDSGIDPQIDFAGRVTAFYDFTAGGGPTTPSPFDLYGHGTHVSGIIASSGMQSSNAQYQGLGPGARLIELRVLDAHGAGQTSVVMQAIEFAINQRAALGIDVINLSLGHPIYEPAHRDPLVRAVETAVRAGIVVVTAAGNFGYNRKTAQPGYAGITSPGNGPSVISVGAVRTMNTIDRSDDTVAPYSSRGPTWYDALAKPDLVAPGDGIISNAPPSSTLYTTYPSVRVDASHMRLNGTSMAAAVTSGIVALVIEASRSTHPFAPALPPNAIKAILQYTATPVGFSQGAPPDALTQGAGAVNVPAALDLARAIDPSQPVGSPWMFGSFSPYSTYANVLLPWGTKIAWGNKPLAGGTVDLNRNAWNPSLAWGKATTWTSDIVPGNDLVWAANIPWPSNIVWGGTMVGSCTGGQTFTWGSSDPPSCTSGQTFTWGSTDDPSSTYWGNLSTTSTNGETFTWGSSTP